MPTAAATGRIDQVDQGEVAIGFDPQIRTAHGFFLSYGPVQGYGQVGPQTLAGHFQDVVGAGLTRRRLQVHAGAAMQIEDIAAAVDERPGRGNLLQKGLFGQFAQRQFAGCWPSCRCPAGCTASVAANGA